MSKPFVEYQYLEGEPMTRRDKRERGSKFWNEGKWNNFVAPLLPRDCREMTLIDVGTNAGLFLKLAKDRGFKRVIGIEPDKPTYERAIAYRDKHGYDYEIINDRIENCIDMLPLADIIILSNVHYYLTIVDWLKVLDKLRTKACYCLIITKESSNVNWRPHTAPQDVRYYFREWEEVGSVYRVSQIDPAPRPLTSFLFKSGVIERISAYGLYRKRSVNAFYNEIDKGTPFEETDYFKYWTTGRNHNQTTEETLARMKQKVALYEDVKKNGQQRPIIIRSDKLILDGYHRLEIMKRLGCRSIIVRKT